MYWLSWICAVALFGITMWSILGDAGRLNRARAAQQKLVERLQTDMGGKPVDQTNLLDTRPWQLGLTKGEWITGSAAIVALGGLIVSLITIPFS